MDTQSQSNIGKYIAAVDILNAVKCSIASGATITMNDINEEFVSLLSENGVNPCSSDHKKLLKSIISENIADVKFVKSHRANENEHVVSEKLPGVAVSNLREQQNEEDDVKCIAKAASILRKQLKTHVKWKFTGSQSLKEFQSPPMLTSFLRLLLLGTKLRNVKEKRDEASTKSIIVVSQQIIQNFKTDRQVTYQPQSNIGFRNRVETPLSVGLALTVHKKTRSKDLVNILSQLQIGSSYNNVVNIEKRIACAVAERMKKTGGFCMPSFVLKGKSVYFAIDNDFLENTADGQNTLHGTILVINQYKESDSDETERVLVDEPLCIPDGVVPVDVSTQYRNPPSIQAQPITVDKFEYHSNDHLLVKYEVHDRAWMMASFSHRESTPTSDEMSWPCEQSETVDRPEQHTGELASKLNKTHIMPTWAATNSLIQSEQDQESRPRTQSSIVAPLLRRPPTDHQSLYTALCQAQGISAFVVGPEHKTIITLDLDLYERALKLQSSTRNTNWILRVGELHACFASLHAIAKYLEGSGLESISVEAGIYSPATIRQIFTGKWFRRGVEYHITNTMACYDLLFEAFLQEENVELMKRKCHKLRDHLNARKDDMKEVFEEVSSILLKLFDATLEQELGEMAHFLRSYMKQVESLLHLIRASRQGECELHLGALEENVKYYFAHDLYKYSRLVPVYLAQMQLLKSTDRETWNALEGGDFIVTKSGIPFTNLFVDQTLEQLIREVKVAGGITGITQNVDALDRFFLIAPELVKHMKEFRDAYCIDNDKSATKEHYQLSGSMAIRMFSNSGVIKKGIVRHCGGNPFACDDVNLMNLVSNMEVPEDAKEDILHRDEKGTSKFEEFASERVVASTAKLSIWEPMQKMKLKTFNTCRKKTRCKVGDKIVKLREDRQFMARFLLFQQSRPNMIQSLNTTIGTYEFSVIPRSLFSTDGLLLIPTDKAAFVHAIEEYNAEQSNEVAEDLPPYSPSTVESPYKVCIVDAMAVVQAIKKGPSMVYCSDFAAAFVRWIKKMISEYNEGRIIFDRYEENSLKAQTRSKRCAGIDPVKFDIKDSTNIKLVPLKTLLSHIETKSKLTEYLGKAALRDFADSNKNVVVVYGDCTYCNKENVVHPDIIEHSHEEADTLIPMHVLDASETDGENRVIDVCSPDTDVFIYLMDLLSTYDISARVRFITGKGKAKRTIDVQARCQAVGTEKSKGLIGLHAFSGADWGGKFSSISKKRWISYYLTLDTDSDAIHIFQNFGENDFELELATTILEAFVCAVYATNSKCQTLAELRWELFRTKNLESEKLPPTLGALKPHIQRANAISTICKGYREPRPQLPSLTANWWETNSDGTISPKKCLQPPAPEAVIELVKCGCRGECSTARCSCNKNNLPCTPLCKCGDCCNAIDYGIPSDEEI